MHTANAKWFTYLVILAVKTAFVVCIRQQTKNENNLQETVKRSPREKGCYVTYACTQSYPSVQRLISNMEQSAMCLWIASMGLLEDMRRLSCHKTACCDQHQKPWWVFEPFLRCLCWTALVLLPDQWLWSLVWDRDYVCACVQHYRKWRPAQWTATRQICEQLYRPGWICSYEDAEWL